MATKNCPKCDSPNPVACKKCACGHVFFTTRRSANAIAAAAESAEDISEPTTPQEPEVPRRRTARVARERPQFYDALQVENQTRRQRELQKKRKASKSDEVEGGSDEILEKTRAASAAAKRRAESPPSKTIEQPTKKRRGRPPGLTNRKTGRAQILANKPATESVNKAVDGGNIMLEDELENVSNLHDIPPVKALQMNLVLSDINSRICSSGVKADIELPPQSIKTESLDDKVVETTGITKESMEDKMEVDTPSTEDKDSSNMKTKAVEDNEEGCKGDTPEKPCKPSIKAESEDKIDAKIANVKPETDKTDGEEGCTANVESLESTAKSSVEKAADIGTKEKDPNTPINDASDNLNDDKSEMLPRDTSLEVETKTTNDVEGEQNKSPQTEIEKDGLLLTGVKEESSDTTIVAKDKKLDADSAENKKSDVIFGSETNGKDGVDDKDRDNLEPNKNETEVNGKEKMDNQQSTQEETNTNIPEEVNTRSNESTPISTSPVMVITET